MRLIADKLEAYGTTVPKECNAEDYLSGARDVLEHIDSMPTVDAVPVEYIRRRIETLNEYISKWGGSFEHEEMVNAYIHEVSALVRLIGDWTKED